MLNDTNNETTDSRTAPEIFSYDIQNAKPTEALTKHLYSNRS